MGEAANNALRYFCRKFDYEQRVRHDKVRHKILRCPVCKAGPLRFIEPNQDEWYLGEFDENNELVRHVCKFKGRWAGR